MEYDLSNSDLTEQDAALDRSSPSVIAVVMIVSMLASGCMEERTHPSRPSGVATLSNIEADSPKSNPSIRWDIQTMNNHTRIALSQVEGRITEIQKWYGIDIRVHVTSSQASFPQSNPDESYVNIHVKVPDQGFTLMDKGIRVDTPQHLAQYGIKTIVESDSRITAYLWRRKPTEALNLALDQVVSILNRKERGR